MNQVCSVQAKFVPPLFRGVSAVAAFLCLSMFAAPAQAQYQRTDLVSNQAGAAPLQDQHLVNGWGLVSLPTSPYWVSDNGKVLLKKKFTQRQLIIFTANLQATLIGLEAYVPERTFLVVLCVNRAMT